MLLTPRPTPIAGAFIVTGQQHRDARGSFARLYCETELASIIGGRRIVQINHSRTTARGAIRGLHYQRPPSAEMKLVRCLRGKVLDVTVDLRANSPTFLRWHAEELSPAEGQMFVIPEGCAHGFQALEPESEMLYLHTAPYAPAAEGGLRFDDPRLGIAWPLPPTDLSDRDRAHPLINERFEGIVA